MLMQPWDPGLIKHRSSSHEPRQARLGSPSLTSHFRAPKPFCVAPGVCPMWRRVGSGRRL